MDELAFNREEAPHYQYLVRKAETQPDFEEYWNLYEFKNQAPEVDFNKGSVFFFGLYESGSCPSKIGKVEPNSDNIRITIAYPDGIVLLMQH